MSFAARSFRSSPARGAVEPPLLWTRVEARSRCATPWSGSHRGEGGRMSDLALAAFAAKTGTHVVREPRERRFERFLRGFDSGRYLAALEAETPPLDDNAVVVLRALSDHPAGADELARATGLGASAVATALAELE